MRWMEDAYFLFSVRLFDSSLTRSHANPKKIYCIDHALVTSVASGILINRGHLLENLVFVTLRRGGAQLFYFKSKRGREVDFIAQKGEKRQLIQVCETLADPLTEKREVEALIEAMEELKLEQATIVTRREEKRIELNSSLIEVKPLWRFLLEEG